MDRMNEKSSVFVFSALRGAAATVFLAACLFLAPYPAKAQTCPDCTCIILESVLTAVGDNIPGNDGFGYVEPIPDAPGLPSGLGQVGDHQTWMILDLFNENILPALQMMAEQLTVVMMEQVFIIGTFIDAKQQLEAQLMFQRLAATAHRDYHPNFGMCVFGTNTRSIAATDFNVKLTAATLSERMIKRQLGSGDALGSQSYTEDRTSRMTNFKSKFCDRYDNNYVDGDPATGFGMICDAGRDPEMINRDIDFMSSFLHPRTFKFDFTDEELEKDEESLMGLALNLYGHEMYEKVGRSLVNLQTNQDEYLDVRSVVAKRSVAQTSFSAVTAMKTQGSPLSAGDGSAETAAYMAVILEELGISEEEIEYMLGERPSYMAQLEVLAKRLYQRPEFYTELYDTRANTKRRGVAMQAINLMLDRDIYDSYLRNEMLMSTLLEMKLIEAQENYADEANAMAPDRL